jgi:hypothetical protein
VRRFGNRKNGGTMTKFVAGITMSRDGDVAAVGLSG